MQPTFSNHAVAQAVMASVLFSSIFPAVATTPLADKPPLSGADVPGNLAITVSVEFPTAVSVAHPNRNYSATEEYLGYFDPDKCYSYNSTDEYFQPEGPVSDPKVTRTCTGFWSGNYMNWATMQTIDPFRWVLTGGYRVPKLDTANLTVLEKAIATGQGGTGNFPDSKISGSVVAGATPFSGNDFTTKIEGRGNRMRFIVGSGSFSNNVTAPQFTKVSDTVVGSEYDVVVRVRVCDASKGLEINCVAYPNGGYKPEGLMQKYSDRIRYSVFGYLNDSNIRRDGAVLRAKQKFIGLTEPVSGGLPKPTANPEWDANTGVMLTNPNPDEATTASSDFTVSITNSGVMNYLNKFGTVVPGSYKTYDPVGELYYAAHRYFRNVGNVPEWLDMGSANTATRTTWLDGFPAIKNWGDPILHSCQRNFILGIGDVNSHADRNVPDATGGTEPSQPTAVSDDKLPANNNTFEKIESVEWTNKIGALMGLGNIGATQGYGGCCNNNGALMAGLAFQANVLDIRKDLNDKQTIQTYWLDVLEYGSFKKNNQFYLATKYGGFDATKYNPAKLLDITSEIPKSLWYSTKDTVPNGDPRPDAYYTAARADQMITGIGKIFSEIASKLQPFTTSFSGALPQVSLANEAIYSSKYDPRDWTGELVASKVDFDKKTGAPTTTEAWKFSSTLSAQLAGTGWASNRRMVTYDDQNKKGIRFTWGTISGDQKTWLDTTYTAGNDGEDFLNYLRGDRSNEKAVGGPAGKGYRDRTSLVGDIVNSKTRAVGIPSAPLSDSVNPGYSTFKTNQKERAPMLVVGTNQGVVHVINGLLATPTPPKPQTPTSPGAEIFGYVPSVLFKGPSGTPSVDGLAGLGKAIDFKHHNYVDATPSIADVDFSRVKSKSSGAPDWRTIAVGGLGKGGKALYALDLTNAVTVSETEDQVADRVLWEFTHPDLGFQFGEPSIVKTEKYGWVVIVGSGYNNTDGQGYFFMIDPRTGALIEKVSTGQGTAANQAGLSAVNTFVLDVIDGTADAVYAGDLLGNLWRWDISGKPTGNFAAPVHLAKLQDASSPAKALPVTARPLIVVQPGTKRRWVTVGTGRLLAASDLGSTDKQRFYAIMDGFNAKFNEPKDLPSAIGAFPITNSSLRQLTNTAQEIKLDLDTEIGWYLELDSAWRVLSDSTAFFGTVSFPAMAPSTGNVCEPSGSSRIYALDLGTGVSSLANKAAFDASSLTGGVVSDLRFYSVAGKLYLFGGTQGSAGMQKPIPIKEFEKPDATRLNWREIPLSN
jgi:type IV pilus assembly protein PilY1